MDMRKKWDSLKATCNEGAHLHWPKAATAWASFSHLIRHSLLPVRGSSSSPGKTGYMYTCLCSHRVRPVVQPRGES
ncbi:unnamed protein product [Protopolystoma xenopodis]|uniref:Uncharacterized protein n=1 Tax=Protopolystoma xenopodis TaxID=117903 RepID=A0A448X9Z5_9PLAT|nr:unnamed protein product [Protopolystoma xenopodis]